MLTSRFDFKTEAMIKLEFQGLMLLLESRIVNIQQTKNNI
jgi:hypothetical protein